MKKKTETPDEMGSHYDFDYSKSRPNRFAARPKLEPGESRTAFRVVANSSPLQPGLDPRGFNQLADELDEPE